MIPQQEPQWCIELTEAGKHAVVTAIIMVDHIPEMKNRIQVQGVEGPDAAVKLSKREPVLPVPIGPAIAILAIGKDPYPDNPVLLGTDRRQSRRQQKEQETV